VWKHSYARFNGFLPLLCEKCGLAGFVVTALVKVQFRAEGYNTFNPTSGAFGTATATQSEARTWPFSLFVKFEWN
jgi:hypothetical protein